MTVVHPKDDTLVFPYVRETLESPEIMLEKVYDEFMQNKQDFNPKTCTLYRVYERDHLIDSVSSHFTEHIRVRCPSGKKPTYVQSWKNMDPEKIREFTVTDDLREYIRKEYGAYECQYFHAGLCIRLYLGFNPVRGPIKIIDPSAGWGCRMLTAIACGDHVSEYVGYDPNPELREPFQRIMSEMDKDKKCSFHNIPFETAPVKVGYYDLGVTSPPYFNLETYSNDPSQSVNTETTKYHDWINKFYIPYLYNLERAIKDNGRIIIYVSNFSINKEFINLADKTLEIYSKHPNVKHIKTGYLRRSDQDRFPRPFFIFHVNKQN